MKKCNACGCWTKYGETFCNGCGSPLDYTEEMSAPKYIVRGEVSPSLDLNTTGNIIHIRGDEDIAYIEDIRKEYLRSDFSDRQAEKLYEDKTKIYAGARQAGRIGFMEMIQDAYIKRMKTNREID